jgi:hypothetical protein
MGHIARVNLTIITLMDFPAIIEVHLYRFRAGSRQSGQRRQGQDSQNYDADKSEGTVRRCQDSEGVGSNV